jgi:hypothetical protein
LTFDLLSSIDSGLTQFCVFLPKNLKSSSMKKYTRIIVLLCVLIAGGLLINSCGSGKISITPDEAKSIAEEVYIYGYPLLTMEYTKRVMTNVEEPGTNLAPVG